ncbi:MAG TPA: DUF87 domain-containing protein [Anaerolineales bacterium]|jgi:hypothetical protein
MSEQFYLGRNYDLKNARRADKGLYYDPVDLTTHAVITGMTGSGKTGLCIGLMEEAALQGIPAILIDPKGDLTNLLLHFPELAPQDFQPWLDADTIRRQGKTLENAASETAAMWKNGLEEWGLDQEQIRKLSAAAHYAVYTPGSDAGLQISVLSSLQAPEIPWEGNKEILREKISSTVTALLGLVGYDDIDPLRSREHILMSNIFESTWSQGKSLDLTELILQVQTPPFEKLGAFPVDNFFPAKDRNLLAMTLNNILASPAFQAWREGAPMDVRSLLFAPDGKPRHSVFYIAHLSDGERMFFVTLLLSAIETWMRTQSGSTSLRALVYFDELYGYLPPTAMPPSKTPLLRMLKQARAFGVGMVLATQNPVDVDYKALSNAGSWFVGKLQTERDKNRLLDGLQSASADLDRNAYSDIISALGKRVFLLHNIHSNGAVLFQTRWTMNFLAGPLTRPQIPGLNRLSGALEVKTAQPVAAAPEKAQPEDDLSEFQPIPARSTETLPAENNPQTAGQSMFKSQATFTERNTMEQTGSQTKPVIPAGVSEYFLPLNYSPTEAFRKAARAMPVDAHLEAVLYRPTLLASARVRFVNPRYGIDNEVIRDVLLDVLDKRGTIRWEEFPYNGPEMDALEQQPAPQAHFITPDAPFGDVKLINALQKDFTDWVFRNTQISARANQALKVFAGPDVSPADFRKACADAARRGRDAEINKLSAVIDRQLAALNDKLVREERELNQDQMEYENRKREETGNMLELGAGFLGFGRKKTLTSQITKNRLSQQARADVDESVDAIGQFKQHIHELEMKRQQVVQDANERWSSVANSISEIPVLPKKSDVYVQVFGVAWRPYYLMRSAGEVIELPAFGSE